MMKALAHLDYSDHLLLAPLFSKSTDYRQIKTENFANMCKTYKDYEDVLPKIANAVARQLASSLSKLSGDSNPIWCKRFFGELCQLKLGTLGGYEETAVLPFVKDVLALDGNVLKEVLKLKTAVTDETPCSALKFPVPVHQVLAAALEQLPRIFVLSNRFGVKLVYLQN